MQNDKKPKISVIIPVYNQSHLISNAINSIVNQTIKDWEIIIVNDGSNKEHYDNLSEIIEKFRSNGHRIGYITEIPNLGIAQARNRGILASNTDIIAIQDADDLSMPDRLEKCLWAIRNADIVYHGAYINMWDQQYNCIGRKYLKASSFNKWRLLKEQYIPGWLVFRKKVWERKPFRKETQYAYDWMMCLDWAFSGFKFQALDEGLYEYVRHEDSASIRFEKEGLRDQSLKEIKRIMKEEYGQIFNKHCDADI